MNPVSTAAADSRQLTDIPVRTAAACRQQNGQNTTHTHNAQHNTFNFSLRRSQQQRIDRVGFPEAACSSSSIAVGIIGSEIIDEFLDYL
jgi:hypothetical protein